MAKAAKKIGKAKASGNSLTNEQAAYAKLMLNRGDRDHDVAAWFGVNGGRIIVVKEGGYDDYTGELDKDLPPEGSPGPKALRMIAAIEKALEILKDGGDDAIEAAIARLEKGRTGYYKSE